MKLVNVESSPVSTNQFWFIEFSGEEYGVKVSKDGEPLHVSHNGETVTSGNVYDSLIQFVNNQTG